MYGLLAGLAVGGVLVLCGAGQWAFLAGAGTGGLIEFGWRTGLLEPIADCLSAVADCLSILGDIGGD